ncbi:MAG: hypothetical protein A2293_12405 [Elusimicrobia bacterium RIFOXYB2_FULL_49_7]|nr:MAG: hypothetical protein A2293_12405 [Elusimicrobia bacterium RIFOXYB2_FULL_49_7]
MVVTHLALLQINSRSLGHYNVIEFSGILDDSVSEQFELLCRNLLNNDIKSYIFDFSGLLKLSRQMAEKVAGLVRRIRTFKGTLYIMGLNPWLRKSVTFSLGEESSSYCLADEEEALQRIEHEPLYCF